MMKVQNAYSSPTEKQIAYANSLAKKAGHYDYRAAHKAMTGKSKIGGLNRQQMSDLIDWLK